MTEAPKQSKGSARPPGLASERHDTLEAIKDSLLSAGQSNELAEENEYEIDLAAENARLDFENRLEKKALRRKWNSILTYLVITGFCLSYLMVFLIGFGIMKFDNPFAVPSVLAAGIIETYGLAKLAIKYFFSNDDEHSNHQRR